MKNNFLLFTSLILLGCIPHWDEINHSDDYNISISTTTICSDSNSIHSATIRFINKSDYDVNVYINNSPQNNSSTPILVKKGASLNSQILLKTDSEDIFFFQYLLPVGKNLIPYFNNDYKAIQITETEINDVIISPLKQSQTNKIYIVLENYSDLGIYLSNYIDNSLNFPCKRFQFDTYTIPKGQNGVYIIDDEQSIESLKICKESIMMKLPINAKLLEKDFIYTIKVTNNTTLINDITPFNIDLKRQIWSIDSSSEFVHCVCKSNQGGVFCFGVINEGLLSCIHINKYGEHKEYFIPCFFLKSTQSIHSISAALQTDDGTIIILSEILNNDNSTEHILFCYNLTENAFKWIYNLSKTFGEDNRYIVNEFSQHTLICSGDNIYAICGALINGDKMCRVFCEIDCSESNNILTKQYISEEKDFSSGIETCFSSIYFDEHLSIYYVLGYDNFNPAYPLDNIHYGNIYKIYDNSGDFKADLIYTAPNCLFTDIDGTTDNIFICGEMKDAGGLLHGCLLTSSMISKKDSPRIFSSSKWFDQVSLNKKGMVFLSGNGQNDCPIVISCISTTGSVLYENSFDGYTNVYGLFANDISYIVDLYTSTDTVAIVSCDLLGKDTGRKILSIE